MEILEKMRDKRTILVAGILLILFLVVLYIRVLPLLNLGTTDILNIVGSDDPMYNLRQIEQMIANYPGYGWFDAMTLYPTGQVVHWGPMVIWIASTMSLIAGATTRPEIIGVALWVPPLLAAFMVPVIYYLVKRVSNWQTGLIGAVLIAVVGGQYFQRALAGYFDHHVAEVFFGSLFILVYIIALQYTRKTGLDFKDFSTLKIPAVLGIVAGITYVLGLFNMPTMVLFALIVGIFSVLQYIWDFIKDRTSAYLFFINCIVFLIAILGFFIIGVQTELLTLAHYSWIHPISYLLFIVINALLFGLEFYLKGKNKLYYPLAILVLVAAGLAVLFTVIPSISGTLTTGIIEFFGQNPYYTTIQEARPWTLEEAWATYSFGLVLMFIGLAVLVYRTIKEQRPEPLLLIIWAILMIYAAWQHVRYEYFLAANIAIAGAIGTGFFLERAWPDIRMLGERITSRKPAEPQKEEKPKEEKGKDRQKERPARKKAGKDQKASAPKKKVNYVNVLVAAVICAFAVIFAVTSVTLEYEIASMKGVSMNQDWREALEWMNTGTPDTGVDYYKIYDQKTFEYPNQSYGVMSWWDYGHLITYIAKRIPNANPFQAGVAGPYGAASFFITRDEGAVNQIADHQGTRYVVTDIEMDTAKFWAMATWFNSTLGPSPYQQIFFVPDNPVNPTTYGTVTVYTDNYFQTMVSRLHNFDGSYTAPGQAYYIEFTTTSGVSPYPVITNSILMDAAAATTRAAEYNRKAQSGYYAEAVSTLIVQPVSTIPALQHYRLVHESPTNVFGMGAPADVKYVKVFEYVPGAKIKGEGFIEVPVVTNTGRHFTWRAESVNGTFTVPYSTEGNPYGVKTAGNYRINATSQEFSVPEAAVMSGASVT